MIASNRDMWCALLWALGSAAARRQQEERDKEALAAIIRFPYRKPTVCTKADFVEPKHGPLKFCANCAKTIHAHPSFANTWCSQCGNGFGPGNHGYSACDEHRRNGKGAA